MIIRQRTTFMDSFLLKVVFPYLEAGNHRSLMRAARYMWNGNVTTTLAPRRQPVLEPNGLGELAGRVQQGVRAFNRWLQPQPLAPIAIVNDRGSRRSRDYGKKG